MKKSTEKIVFLGDGITARVKANQFPHFTYFEDKTEQKIKEGSEILIEVEYREGFRNNVKQVLEFEKRGRTIVIRSVDLYAEFNKKQWKAIISGKGGFENLLRVACAFSAPDKGGILLHSAGAVSINRGLIFPGPSGAGKSTIAGFLKEREIKVLNDDLTMLFFKNRGIHISSTPFGDSSEKLITASLAGIFFPVKDQIVKIKKIDKSVGIARLISCSAFLQYFPEALEKAIDLLHSHLAKLSFYNLHFSKDSSFVSMLENFILRERK